MITQFFIDLGVHIAQWFVGLIPTWTVPTWLTGLDDTVSGIFVGLSGTGAWIPWPYLAVLAAAVLVVWGIGFGVRALAKVVAFLPFIGGSG